jgi:hypothetical protein
MSAAALLVVLALGSGAPCGSDAVVGMLGKPLASAAVQRCISAWGTPQKRTIRRWDYPQVKAGLSITDGVVTGLRIVRSSTVPVPKELLAADKAYRHVFLRGAWGAIVHGRVTLVALGRPGEEVAQTLLELSAPQDTRLTGLETERSCGGSEGQPDDSLPTAEALVELLGRSESDGKVRAFRERAKDRVRLRFQDGALNSIAVREGYRGALPFDLRPGEDIAGYRRRHPELKLTWRDAFEWEREGWSGWVRHRCGRVEDAWIERKGSPKPAGTVASTAPEAKKRKKKRRTRSRPVLDPRMPRAESLFELVGRTRDDPRVRSFVKLLGPPSSTSDKHSTWKDRVKLSFKATTGFKDADGYRVWGDAKLVVLEAIELRQRYAGPLPFDLRDGDDVGRYTSRHPDLRKTGDDVFRWKGEGWEGYATTQKPNVARIWWDPGTARKRPKPVAVAPKPRPKPKPEPRPEPKPRRKKTTVRFGSIRGECLKTKGCRSGRGFARLPDGSTVQVWFDGRRRFTGGRGVLHFPEGRAPTRYEGYLNASGRPESSGKLRYDAQKMWVEGRFSGGELVGPATALHDDGLVQIGEGFDLERGFTADVVTRPPPPAGVVLSLPVTVGRWRGLKPEGEHVLRMCQVRGCPNIARTSYRAGKRLRGRELYGEKGLLLQATRELPSRYEALFERSKQVEDQAKESRWSLSNALVRCVGKTCAHDELKAKRGTPGKVYAVTTGDIAEVTFDIDGERQSCAPDRKTGYCAIDLTEVRAVRVVSARRGGELALLSVGIANEPERPRAPEAPTIVDLVRRKLSADRRGVFHDYLIDRSVLLGTSATKLSASVQQRAFTNLMVVDPSGLVDEVCMTPYATSGAFKSTKGTERCHKKPLLQRGAKLFGFELPLGYDVELRADREANVHVFAW